MAWSVGLVSLVGLVGLVGFGGVVRIGEPELKYLLLELLEENI